jgi:hypothetical protein
MTDKPTKIRSMVLESLQRGSDRYYVNAIFYNISALAQVSQMFIKALEQTLYEEVAGDVVSVISNHVSIYRMNKSTKQLTILCNRYKDPIQCINRIC